MKKSKAIPDRTIARLSLYRRMLYDLDHHKVRNVFSHQIAASTGFTAAQVRRDIMVVGYAGSPRNGYDVKELTQSISRLLDAPEPQDIALVGVGNLGRAIIAYFSGRRPKLRIVASFDMDPAKTNRLIHGCFCHPVIELEDIVKKKNLSIGIITVPAEEAQSVADILIRAGVKGIMNFAPIKLLAPPEVYIENMDITTSLEKVAYFARI